MESRLPKPKIVVEKNISTTEMSVNMNNMKTGKNLNSGPSSNGCKEKLQKAKSTLNLNAKVTNENKAPLKSTLLRSKTMSAITRGINANTTTNRALKRPAVVTTHGDVKKPFTRTTVKPALKSGALTSNSVIKKVPDNNTNKKPAPAKPSKWDLKGRLAHVSQELCGMKQKHQEVAAKYKELQEKINTLQANETLYSSQVKELEGTNTNLNTELNKLKLQIDEVQEEREQLSKQLKEIQESKRIISDTLKECKERCASQETLLAKQTVEVENLRSNVGTLTKTNHELSTEKEALQSLVHRMDKDRRVLHNTIQELKGNIRVFCRVRPRTDNECMKTLCAMNFADECTIEVGKSDGSDSISCSGKQRGTKQEFSFDKVFPPNATQQDIFEELSLLVQSALEGYNVCVFAYGQTGSGKTYTMEGLPGIETEGMIPRTVRHIFKEMKQFQLFGWEYKIEASFLEIYNEHIVDLLDSQPKVHEIRMADSKGNDLYVSNLKIVEIHSPEELHECLLTAQRNRAVAATLSNERSSRSHSIARIKLIGTHLAKEEISIGNLNLVDLAGSERLRGEESVRMAETKNINKSLANLGNVILALLKKQEHVPYRNSKLTHLLMPSLGGNSKTLMLLNISPLDECYNETLNSLRFANNVNNCKTGNIKRTRTVLQNTS